MIKLWLSRLKLRALERRKRSCVHHAHDFVAIQSSPSTAIVGLQEWRAAQADFNARIEAAREDHAKVRYIQEERVAFVTDCLRGSA